jgi:hypothetical protein
MNTLPSRRVQKRDQRVRRILRAARVVMPWLSDVDVPALRAWAELEVLSRQAYDKIRERGIVADDGTPYALVETYQRLRKTQLSFETQLAMTPKSRADIQGGGRASLPLDATYERIQKTHDARHKDEDVPAEA